MLPPHFPCLDQRNGESMTVKELIATLSTLEQDKQIKTIILGNFKDETETSEEIEVTLWNERSRCAEDYGDNDDFYVIE